MHSTEVATPDRVDVVVCETLGNYPFEENIVETLNDARARFLKPGGIVIPRARRAVRVPGDGRALPAELSVWDEVGYGLDFAPAKTMTLNNIYVRRFEPGDLLDGGAAAQSWDKLTFDRTQQDDALGRGQLAAQEAHHRLRPGAVVVGGAGRRRRRSRPGRSIRTRTGSSSICRPWRRSRWSRDRRWARACAPPRPSSAAPT